MCMQDTIHTYLQRNKNKNPGSPVMTLRALQSLIKYAITANTRQPTAKNACIASPANVRCEIPVISIQSVKLERITPALKNAIITLKNAKQ